MIAVESTPYLAKRNPSKLNDCRRTQ